MDLLEQSEWKEHRIWSCKRRDAARRSLPLGHEGACVLPLLDIADFLDCPN